ncbi:MAG TPA: hypothetical protein VF109_10600 [Mycobacteriales bacterium]
MPAPHRPAPAGDHGTAAGGPTAPAPASRPEPGPAHLAPAGPADPAGPAGRLDPADPAGPAGPVGRVGGEGALPGEVGGLAGEVAGLDELAELPVAEHVARYDALHGRLSDALSSIDGV